MEDNKGAVTPLALKTSHDAQIKRKDFLYFFNKSLIGQKILLHHSPSGSWFFGLVLLETRNTIKIMGWQFSNQRLRNDPNLLPNHLKSCLKKLHDVPIQDFLKALPSKKRNKNEKDAPKHGTEIVSPSECINLISPSDDISCKTFPKEAIVIFWKVPPDMNSNSRKKDRMIVNEEIFIRIEGKSLIGRPWERLNREPRGRW